MYEWFVRRGLFRIILILMLFAPSLWGGENSADTVLTATPEPESSELNTEIFIENVRQRLDALEEQSGRHSAIARLKILQLESVDKTNFFTEAVGFKGRLFRKIITELDEIFKLLEAGIDPLAGRTGLIEGAYISQVDGSVQPYQLYIPTSYGNVEGAANPEPGKLPLVIRYHGYNPSYKRTAWIEIGKRAALDLEKTGMAMLMPFGRSNTDFLSVGEVDVFAALEAVARRYPIDRRRLYLMGYSMGGSGAWTTLAHYPDIFAAAYIRSGRTDYYYWHNLKREEMPAYLRLLIDTDNPLDLAKNIRAVPLRIFHPGGDTVVKPGHTAYMAERLNQLGRAMINGLPAPFEANMPPGGSHWDFRSKYTNQEIYEWMLGFQLDQSPTEVELTTFTPKYGKRAWLNIETIKKWGKQAYVRARIDLKTNAIVIAEMDNVSFLTIDPKALPTGLNQDEWEDVNPDEYGLGKAPLLQIPEQYEAIYQKGTIPVFRFQIVDKGAGPPPMPPLRKTSWLCGPVKEAFNAPFMLVRGTIGTAEETMHLAAMCKRFEKEWLLFAKGEAIIKDDIDITPEDIKRYNLICFGAPLTNDYLTKTGAEVPFKFFQDGYGVGEAVVQEGMDEELGFLGSFPNPLADDRLLVIADGLYYGDYLGINHKWDLVPDYLIFTKVIGYEGTNKAALAGFFDSSWQVDTTLQYRDQNR